MKLNIFNRGLFFILLLWATSSNVSFCQTVLFSEPGPIVHPDIGGTINETYGAGVDISNCTSVLFTFDYQFSLGWEGSGNMETAGDCGSFGSCNGDPSMPLAGTCMNCWDFLVVDFLVDGTPIGGGFIGGAGTTDAEQSGSFSASSCTGGISSTAQINAITQNWAPDEAVTYTNITIVCYEAAPTAMASPLSPCVGETINLDGSIVDPFITTTDWTGPGLIDDPSSLSTFVTGLGAGSHTFTLTSTDDNSCMTSATTMVNILPAPSIGAPDPLDICFSFAPPSGEIFNLTTVETQLTGGDGSLFLEWWFDSDATNPILNIFDLLNAPLPGSIFATVTDGSSCRSAVQEVFFNATPYPILATDNGELAECPGVFGNAIFAPSDADDQFTGGDGSLTVSYHNTPNDAENDVSPIFGTVDISSNLQLFVRITNAAGCASTATLDLIIDNSLMAREAALNTCDSGNGSGVFDLSLIENEVLNGNSGTVQFYEDFALSTPIFSPFAYISSGGIIFAVINDSGCTSTPVEIELSLNSFDFNDFSLSFSPTSACGATDVVVTLHTPGFPNGEYSFLINYGPISTGLATNTTLFGSEGDEALTINIDESYFFSLISVTSPAPQSCLIEFTPAIMYDVMISSASDATPATMATCPEEDGQGIYNLLTLHDSINVNTADTVLFFIDFDLNNPIGVPDTFITIPDTIYAVIDEGGGCLSAPVEVILIQDTIPGFSIALQQPISCTGSSNAILNIQDTIGSFPFTYDWSVDIWDNSTNNTGVGPGEYFLSITDANMCISVDSITVLNPPILNLICHENTEFEGNGIGSYSFTYNGGTPDYSLTLVGPFNDSFTNSLPDTWDSAVLPGGTYTFTITDANNCMESCTFTICDLVLDCSQTTSPSLPGNTDGNLMLVITGGTSDYTVNWTGPINGTTTASASGTTLIPNLTDGMYTVTVIDVNNCMASCNFTINPANCTFTVQTTSTNINCNSDSTGTISFVLNGGMPDYNFVWSDSDLNSTGPNGDKTNLPAGDYAVTITDDNNCVVNANITLTEPPLLMLDCHQNEEGEGNNIGSFSFAYSGGTPFYILDLSGPVDISFTVNTPDTWNTAVLPEGNYTFTLTDSNGCSETCNFTIPPPCNLVIGCSNTTSPSAFVSADGSLGLQIAGGTPPYAIDWMGPVSGSGVTPISGIFTIMDLVVGPYTVTVTDANGCEEICGFLISNPDCTFMAAISGLDISCNGDSTGTINFTFVNGAPDYTFTWNVPELNSQGPGGNQVNLPAGDYIVTVVDNNSCDTTLTITLNEPPVISLSCSASLQPSQSSNSDGVINVVINNGPAGAYTINYDNQIGTSGSIAGLIGSNPVPGLAEGTYLITVINGTCQETCEVILTASNCTFGLEIARVNETCIDENDGSATAIPSGGNPAFIFNWSNTEQTALITGLVPGPYFLTVTDDDGCVALDTVMILAGSVNPTLDFGNPASTICADSCIAINLMATGQAPYMIDYIIHDITGIPLIDQITIPDNTGILEFCPSDLGLLPGLIDFRFIAISDTNCSAEIDQSFVTTYLTPAIGSIDTVLCQDENFILGGTIFDQSNLSGQAILNNAASSNCDSLVNVSISYYIPEVGSFDSTLCIGNSLFFGGILFDESNLSGQVTLLNAANLGCDSLVDVTIQYFEAADTLIERDICQNDTLTIGGELFHANNLTGNILLEGLSFNNCDSMITVNLTVTEKLFGNMGISLCAGDTIVIQGQEFHENLLSDTIPLNILSSSGCDTSLIITVNLLQAVVNPISTDICPGDSMLIGDQFFHDLRLSDTIVLDNAASNGCDSIIEVNLNLLTIPTFNLTTQICEGDTLFIGNNMQIIEGMVSYTLAGMASNGCDSIVNVDLSFFEAATSVFEPVICTGDTVMVGDQVFHVDNTNGLVILASASINGCDSTVMVNVNFLPNTMGNLDTMLCFGESLQIGDQVFDATTPNGFVVFEDAAVNGCDSTLFVSTTYFDELSASLIGGTVICPGESVELELVTTNNFTYSYTIDQENGSPFEGNNLMGNQTLTVTPVQNTVYTLTEITSASNCPILISESTAAVLVSNLDINAIVTSDFNGFGVSCAGLSDGAAQVNIIDGIGPFVYQWSNSESTASINNLSTGDYAVMITDGAGCTRESNISLTSPLEMTASAQGIADGCFGENGGRIVIDTIINGTSPYEYSRDGEFFSPLGTFPITIPQLEAGNYDITIQDANDCAVNTTVNVPETQELVLLLEIPEDENPIKLGDSVLLKPQINFTPSSWTWTPPDYLSEPGSLITQAAPVETIIYKLEVTGENGCTVSKKVTVFVDKRIEIYVPSAFSPNLDGTNDVLLIYASSSVASIETFQIYDRWGNLMFSKGPFHANDPESGWDGELNGEPLNAAVFVYMLKAILITGEEVIVKGEVMLMR